MNGMSAIQPTSPSTGSCGTSAASGRAEALIAVAPYTKPQTMMYGPKYQEVHRPTRRQPSKIEWPVARVQRPAPSTSTILMITPATAAHRSA